MSKTNVDNTPEGEKSGVRELYKIPVLTETGESSPGKWWLEIDSFFFYICSFNHQHKHSNSDLMQQANLFTLHNATLKVSYSASSLDGKPQLSYQKGAISLNFRGSQVRHKPTEIGILISVTLKTVPDSRTVVFSLLLPLVNVPDDRPSIPVSIKAIETTNRTSIAGPKLVKGQVQTYKVYSLKGSAQSVLF